jgi:D-alanyl-D-alanine carboxypeptidase
MRTNFQSLLLVILILFSLLITKEAKIEAPTVKQPASFLESVIVTSLNPLDAAEADIPKVYLPKSTTSVPLLPNFSQPAGLPVLNLRAKAVLVSDLDNDADFIIYNINQRWPLASITKLMTAVLALEEIGQEKEAVVSETAVATEGEAGKLETGQLYKIEDLIKIMLVTSSNDAAVALAEFYVFGQKNFVKMMNKKAVDLGMTQTVFFDPVGLSSLNQSTASDIRKLIKYIDKTHTEIFAYSRETNFGELKNINPFAGQADFLGGKTGYLDEAKENLVSLFSVNEQRILVILLGADDRFNQTRELLSYLFKI